MSKGRILIIVQNLPVPFDRRVWQEAQALRDEGYELAIICPKGGEYNASYERRDGIHIHRYFLPFEARNALGFCMEYTWSLLCQFYLACTIFVHRGFDAIHACNPPDTIFLIGGFFKCLFGTRFLFDHHDINPELYEAKFSRRDFFYKMLLLCERLTFMTADISIATNNSYRGIAITRGRMPPEKIFVVRSGPDLDRITIKEPVAALRHGRKYLVGYLGVMGKQEGIDLLLEAVRHIVYDLRRNDIHFTLIGDGPERNNLIRLSEEKQLMDFVTFMGRISDDDLLDILSTADLCVNPDAVNTMNDKSTMNKILEYMALAKPIVQFDLTEGRVSAGNASLYAAPNDTTDFAEKIIELIDNPSKCKSMGEYGRMRVEKELAWEHQIPHLLAAYDVLFSIRSLHQKCKWYYYRLKAMPVAEVPHRIHQKIRRVKDRYFPPQSALSSYDSLPSLPGIKETLRTTRLPDVLVHEWEALRVQVTAGNFFLLAEHWPPCAPQDKWHLDPVTGHFWPRDAYCFDIPYRHTSHYGDVKYVWELNRLQYLQPLATLALTKKDTKLAAFCIDEIESWIDANPPYRGINWVSGIELALRLVSILWIITLLEEYISDQQRSKIAHCIETHTLWLERYPSRFSSANNHLAAEALALFLIGTLRPQSPLSMRRKKYGWRLLCDAVQNLILPDGAGAEQAIAYTAFTLEMLMLGLYVAECRPEGIRIPEYYRNRLEMGGEFLFWFTDCRGNHPAIGDDDNACIIGSYSSNFEPYVNSVLSALTAFTERPDLTPPQSAPQLRNIVFGILTDTYTAPTGLRTFHDGGYSIVRHTHNEQEILLALDHGPLGYGSIAAHGHADALSMWLHIDGLPVLADAGNYLYHANDSWRRFFRSTCVHNTVRVEETDSSVMCGSFNWSHKANARITANRCTENEWHLEAEHDGYLKRFGIIHRRVLNVKMKNGFTVEDSVSGKYPCHVEVGFLIHPSLKLAQNGNDFILSRNGKSVLRLTAESALKAEVQKSWYAPRFGEKIPAQRITSYGTIRPGARMITKFYYL